MRPTILAVVLFPTLLLSYAAPIRAIEMAYSHRDLVTSSDVIVVATLTNVDGQMKNGYFVEQGDLHVERVVCGDVKPGQVLVLRWQNFPNVACPRVEHGRRLGESRLWFLQRDASGVFLAGTDQRSWPVEEVETFLDTLAAYPYHVVTPRYDLGKAVIVTIEFRNATASPLSVPTVKVADGRVTYGDGFGIVFQPRHAYTVGRRPDKNSGGFAIPASQSSIECRVRPDRLQYDERLARTILAPGESVRAELSFSDILEEMPPGRYRFDVRIAGRRTSHGVQVLTAWETGVERVRDTPGELTYYIQTIRKGLPETDAALSMLRLKRTEAPMFAGELISLCDSLEAATRVRVMGIITWLDIPHEAQMDFFLDRVGDPAPEVHRAAVGGAGHLAQSGTYRRDEAAAWLMGLLDDEDPAVRGAVIGTISNARIAEALPSLRFIARYDSDAETRRAAWWAVDVIEKRNPCTGRSLEP